MASILNSRLYCHDTLWTFTPLYPTQSAIRQTGFDKNFAFLRNAPLAFDICGRSCYNECTKGNTADRRSSQIWLITKRTRILWPRRLLFCVVYVCYQDSRSDDFRNYQNDCLAFARNPV